MPFSRLIFLCLFLVLQSARAEFDKSQMKPLYFEKSKNNVLLLNQRLDYVLSEDEKLILGDSILDFREVKFNITASKKKNYFQFQFRFPYEFLRQGDVVLLDNAGKQIWKKSFQQKDLRPINADRPATTENNKKPSSSLSLVADLNADNIDEETLDKLSTLPFFNFCVSRAEDSTRLYLCSKDYFLVFKKNKFSLSARPVFQKKPQIMVNGNQMPQQALIYLNDKNESLLLNVKTTTGSSLELITKQKPSIINDITQSPRADQVIISMTGAKPRDQANTENLGDDNWKLTTNKEKPYFYVESEGGIPLRQEYTLTGEVPTDQLRPWVYKNSMNKTYSESLEIRGYAADNTEIQGLNENQNPDSKITMLEDNEFVWQMSNLKTNKFNRREAEVVANGKRYRLSYQIQRVPSTLIALDAYADLVNSIPYGRLQYMKAIDHLPLSKENSFQWSYYSELSIPFLKRASVTPVQSLHLGMNYRFKPGFWFEDTSWAMTPLLSFISMNGTMTTALGTDVLYTALAPKAWERYLNWHEYRLRLHALSFGSNKLAPSWDVSWTGYSNRNSISWWKYMFSINSIKSDPSNSDDKMQVNMEFGHVWRF